MKYRIVKDGFLNYYAEHYNELLRDWFYEWDTDSFTQKGCMRILNEKLNYINKNKNVVDEFEIN